MKRRPVCLNTATAHGTPRAEGSQGGGAGLRPPRLQVLLALRKLQQHVKSGAPHGHASVDSVRLLRRVNAIGPFTYLMLPVPQRALREAAEGEGGQVLEWSRAVLEDQRMAKQVRRRSPAGVPAAPGLVPSARLRLMRFGRLQSLPLALARSVAGTRTLVMVRLQGMVFLSPVVR